jgi:hypothetical protein
MSDAEAQSIMSMIWDAAKMGGVVFVACVVLYLLDRATGGGSP